MNRSISSPLIAAAPRAAWRRIGTMALLLALALAARLWTIHGAGELNADEVLPGLMGLHIAAGREAPVFFYGQSYFGALESYVLAGMFRVLGFHPWLLVVPALISSLLLIPCVIALANEVGHPSTAWLAAAPLAVPPPPLARLLVSGGSGFSLAFLLQGLVLLGVLRALKEENSDAGSWARGWWVRRRAMWWLGGAAFCAGLLCWIWQPALPLCAALAAVVLWKRPLLRRRPTPLAVGALTLPGLLPPLLYNLTHHFATVAELVQKYGAVGREAVGGLPRGPMGTATLVALAFGGGDEALGGVNPALSALALCAVPLLVAATWIRGSAHLCEDDPAKSRRRATTILTLAAVVDVLAAHGEARQIVPAALVAYVCLAALPGVLFSGRAPRFVAAAIALAIVVPDARLMALPRVSFVRFVPSVGDVQLIVKTLEERHLRAGYSDYWSAYPVTYFSGERTIVAPLVATIWGGHFDRYPAYTARVEAEHDPSELFLLLDDRCSVLPYLAPLTASGVTYRLEHVGAWMLVSQLTLSSEDEAQTMERLRAVMAARNVC